MISTYLEFKPVHVYTRKRLEDCFFLDDLGIEVVAMGSDFRLVASRKASDGLHFGNRGSELTPVAMLERFLEESVGLCSLNIGGWYPLMTIERVTDGSVWLPHVPAFTLEGISPPPEHRPADADALVDLKIVDPGYPMSQQFWVRVPITELERAFRQHVDELAKLLVADKGFNEDDVRETYVAPWSDLLDRLAASAT